MTSVFDSDLKLLGNNIAKCHQLIAEALKANSQGQNENPCQHRVQRLCTSQLEQNKLRNAPNSSVYSKAATSRAGVSSNVGLKSNVTLKNPNNRDKVSQMTTSTNCNRKPWQNQTDLNSNRSRNLENYKIFSATKTITGNRNNPPRLSKARCPPAGTRPKSVKSRIQERQKPLSNVLREQNGTAKYSESDTDVNRCMMCDQPEKMEGPTHSVSCNHIVHSDFSGNTRVIGDSVQVVNQSVQCVNNDQFSMSNNEKTASTFSMFNPVRTLHFLMQELEGKMVTFPDSNVKRILMEMEDTLQRIPGNSKKFSPSSVDNSQNADSNECPPQKLSKITAEMHETKNKLSDSGGKAGNENLQLKLELSCSKLEKACQTMEKACSELKKERDFFKNELHHKKKAYEELLKKEASYIQTINDLKQNLISMTTKADEHTKSIENLNIVLDQLQEENKVVFALKDLRKKLNERLRETTQENEKLNSELQIVTLEREKLALLLASRDEEIAKVKQDFGEVQEFVSDQLMNTSMKKDPVPSINFSLISIESGHKKKINPTPESNNLTKSSTCFRSSVPSGWHVLNSGVTDSTALKSGNRTSSTDKKNNLTATNLIDSIRTLLSEMKQEPIVEAKQSVPNYDTIEGYVVPQLSDTTMSSQQSAHDISQISSLSTLTL